MQINVKPVLKWAGGKRELLSEIRKFHENYSPKKYVEPFFGGGSVYFDILNVHGQSHCETAIINDINSDLINMYKDIKTSPEKIIKGCNELEEEYYKYDYYHIRDRFNGIDRKNNKVEKYKGIERSSALILLNKTGFNGMYRVNRQGLFNIPKGSYKKPLIVDEENLYKLSSSLPKLENIRNTQFYNIQEVEKGDLVYFDPPYDPVSKTSYFTSYSGLFGKEEQIRLRDYFEKLDSMGVKVILSNSSTSFIKKIYKEFNISEVHTGRFINSKGSRRGKVTEYLITGKNV